MGTILLDFNIFILFVQNDRPFSICLHLRMFSHAHLDGLVPCRCFLHFNAGSCFHNFLWLHTFGILSVLNKQNVVVHLVASCVYFLRRLNFLFYWWIFVLFLFTNHRYSFWCFLRIGIDVLSGICLFWSCQKLIETLIIKLHLSQPMVYSRQFQSLCFHHLQPWCQNCGSLFARHQKCWGYARSFL